MWGMEIGKRLAEKRMRNTADLRKDIYSVFCIGMASTLYCRKASILIIIGAGEGLRANVLLLRGASALRPWLR